MPCAPTVSPCVLCVSSLGASPPFRSTAVLEQSLKRWQPCHAPSPLTCPSICHHPAPQPSFLWKFYLGEQMAPPTPISNARAPIPCSWYGCLHVNFYFPDSISLVSKCWNVFLYLLFLKCLQLGNQKLLIKIQNFDELLPHSKAEGYTKYE